MNLFEEILLDILSRLPVQSLIRFKCVSKKWYALIQSPDFVDMHLSLQLTTSDHKHIQTLRQINGYYMPEMQYVVTQFDNLESLSQLTPPDLEVPGYRFSDDISTHVQFGNHLNGIVCMFNVYRAKITLWNPALREFRVLPPRPFQCPSEFNGGYPLAIGFGFDDATNDYKVVCVERFVKDDPPPHEFKVVQVYNLKSNSWRILETTAAAAAIELLPDDLSQCTDPVFFKGSVHWLRRGLPIILTFNTTTELFGEIRFPFACKDYSPRSGISRLFVLDDSTLSLVSDFSPRRHPRQLHVWVMDDYNVKDAWTKQYSITHGLNISCLLSFWRNDKLLFVTTDGLLICCDLPTGQRHHIRRYADGECSTLDVVVCIETLVSIM